VALAVPIRATPVADAYLPAERRHESQVCFPLDLYLCTDCGHTQLLDVVDPEFLFRDYIYSTSISLGLVDHFRRYAADVTKRFAIPSGALAVDIGSNDGTLLRFLQEKGLRVLGFDPAVQIAQKATAQGIPTTPEFFSPTTAQQALEKHGPATLVTANNVFAHADNLRGMADGIAQLLAPNGVFIFEVSYIGDIIERYLFDTVYHEHLCYHALAPLVSFFARHGLQFFDVERVANKGGSIRGFVQKAGGPRPVSNRLAAMLEQEKQHGWTELPTFQKYAAELEAIKQDVRATLETLKAEGKRIAGFGASATVTTLLHNFELGEYLDFIVDDNVSRHGLYSPGYGLPVLPPSELYQRRVDVVLVAAWQYADPIIRRHAAFAERGGKFLVPLPKPKWLQPVPAALASVS
jgi:SAM-dependent methyltransferase